MTAEPQPTQERAMRSQGNHVPSLIPIPDPSVLSTEALGREIGHLREVMESRVDARGALTDRRFADMDKAIELLETATATIRSATALEVDRAVKAARDVIMVDLKAEANLTAHRFEAERVLTSQRIDMSERTMVAGLSDLGHQLAAKSDDLVHQLAAAIEAIGTQIHDQDRRFEQSKLDSKAAIDAALQAAKEAVGKTELNTGVQLAALQVLIAANTKATDDKIDAIKENFAAERNRVDAVTAGQANSYSGSQGTLIGERAAQARFYALIGFGFTVVLGILTIVGFALAR